MERCPNCAARWDGRVTCRRCGMELAGLIRVEQAAESLIARAMAHLEAADPEAASADLIQALALHRTPFAERLLNFAQWTAREERDDSKVIAQCQNQVGTDVMYVVERD
ncbi:hypothetical protein CCR95_20320 [Thiocystis minor]|uniref:hypothetical protein n=1 Tax=Thiocystis minor TaxID=61597 RepID=UPI0019149444|nr:hypothetical protein [Thiocystis minor]MBK5966364.1 hypothetical protein [Thiocystis minor]